MQEETFRHSIACIRELTRKIARPLRLMEVCGTHTVAVCRSGLRALLPSGLHLLSGPGCPVCVTPAAYIDRAILLARSPEVLIATFGDLMRVPGLSLGTLENERAKGAKVQVVYSVADALALAGERKNKKVIFLAVGFETTAPGMAWAVKTAAERGIENFMILNALKTMPNAMEALLKSGDVHIDGFICPGHVSAIIGSNPYEFIRREYSRPCVVAGFEPSDVAEAVAMLLAQIAEGRCEVQNQYLRAVSVDGNEKAKVLLDEIFEPADAEWRGLGDIPQSGLKLRDKFKKHDADLMYSGLRATAGGEKTGCRCGDVLRGLVTPMECKLFGKKCKPDHPVGACMVSSEGSCAAYYRYEKQ